MFPLDKLFFNPPRHPPRITIFPKKGVLYEKRYPRYILISWMSVRHRVIESCVVIYDAGVLLLLWKNVRFKSNKKVSGFLIMRKSSV